MSDWILVVDDDVLNLKMAKHILSGSNMRVSCLKSGEEAVEFLKKNSPDLLLLDVHMPGMNGFETISVIRENKNIADIPVIFLTTAIQKKRDWKPAQWTLLRNHLFRRCCCFA